METQLSNTLNEPGSILLANLRCGCHQMGGMYPCCVRRARPLHEDKHGFWKHGPLALTPLGPLLCPSQNSYSQLLYSHGPLPCCADHHDKSSLPGLRGIPLSAISLTFRDRSHGTSTKNGWRTTVRRVLASSCARAERLIESVIITLNPLGTTMIVLNSAKAAGDLLDK